MLIPALLILLLVKQWTGIFLSSCATLHCQGSSPASELKLSPENNNVLVTEHGTS